MSVSEGFQRCSRIVKDNELLVRDEIFDPPYAFRFDEL